MTSSKRGADSNAHNEIARKKTAKQYNVVTEQGVPVLIRKKRHMSGLMCPPMGAAPKVVRPLDEQSGIERNS